MSGKAEINLNPTSSTVAVSGLLQRKCACGTHTIAGGECESCKNEKASMKLQRATRNSELENHYSHEVPPIVHEVLRSPGQPLDAATRNFFEPRFGREFRHMSSQTQIAGVPSRLDIGATHDLFEQEADLLAQRTMGGSALPIERRHDFSGVRIHTDAKAAESAEAVGSLAYTVGRDVVFATGQYSPETAGGQRLLAHELAHVQQQQNSVQGEVVQRKKRERIPLLSGIYDFFSNIVQAISSGFANETLQEYLDTIIETDKIEDSFDSDNKALEVFKIWKAGTDKSQIKIGTRTFSLTNRLKSLLSQELRQDSVSKEESQAAQELDNFSLKSAEPVATPSGTGPQPAKEPTLTAGEKGAAKIREGLRGQVEIKESKGRKFQVGGVEADETTQSDIKTNNVLINKEDTAHIEFFDRKLGIDTAYTTPRDPFRWNTLKEIIATGKVDILAVSEDTEFNVREATGGNIDKKVEKISLKLIPGGGARGATVVREELFKLTAASKPPRAISFVSATARDQVYYSRGFASLSHEFFGHLWLDMNGVPSGHGETLAGTHTMKDPFGEPFTGSVNDYIAIFVQQSPSERKGKAVNPPSSSLEVTDQKFEEALQAFIQAASGPDAFTVSSMFIRPSKEFLERWKALERFYQLLLANVANEGKRLSHIIAELKKVYATLSDDFQEGFDIFFFYDATSPGTGLMNPKGHVVGELKIRDPRQRPKKKEKGKVQRMHASPYPNQFAPPIVHTVLGSTGRPLDGPIRTLMESRFHQDFSRVRVHTDARADESARAVNALAYTVGQQIIFAHGQYQPSTTTGRRLLSHELAHTIQQGAVWPTPEASRLTVGQHDDADEREANLMASGLPTSSHMAPTTDAPRVQRQPAFTAEDFASRALKAGPADKKEKATFEKAGKAAADIEKKGTPITRVQIPAAGKDASVKGVSSSTFASEVKKCPSAKFESGVPKAFLCATNEIAHPEVATDDMAKIETNVRVGIKASKSGGSIWVTSANLPWSLSTAGFLDIDAIDSKMLKNYESHEKGHATIATKIRDRLSKLMQAELDSALPTEKKPLEKSGSDFGQKGVDAIVDQISKIRERYMKWFDELSAAADSDWDAQEKETLSKIAAAIKAKEPKPGSSVPEVPGE